MATKYALVNTLTDAVINVYDKPKFAISMALDIVQNRPGLKEIAIIPITSTDPEVNAQNDPIAFIALKSYYNREIKSDDTVIKCEYLKAVQYDYEF